MNSRACKHEKVDRLGYCRDCGAPPRPVDYDLYHILVGLADVEEEANLIDELEYARQLEQLEQFKQWATENNTWHPPAPNEDNE